MIGVSNIPSSSDSTTKNSFDISKMNSTNKLELQNSLGMKMDALIELLDTSKNRLALQESHNKTKGKEVENEYNFLKQIGDVCKRSCNYYFETNINFHESCENFNILFKTFTNSLVDLTNKNTTAENIVRTLQDIERQETDNMTKKKEKNEKTKEEFELLEKEVYFMNTESKNLMNKIKEIVYQINQHKEAFESFFILTNLNYEKIALLENHLKELKEEEKNIINEINDTNENKKKCDENLITQKEQIAKQKEELIEKEKELKLKKDQINMFSKELMASISIIESQGRFLENQILSQEYYLNVISTGYEESVKRKEMLEETIKCATTDIERLDKETEAQIKENEREKNEHRKLESNLEKLQKEVQLKTNELLILKKEESVSNMEVVKAQKKVEENMLNHLRKEKDYIEEKIANYKEEIKTLLITEEKKIHLLKDMNVGYTDNKDLIKNLEKVLEEYKTKIKEQQEKQWRNEKAIKKMQIKIKDIKEKLEEEKQKKEDIDILINENTKELTKMKKKKEDVCKKLTTIKKEKKQLETKYNNQNEELQKIENKLSDMNKKIESSVLQLHKKYEEKTKELYDGKGEKIGISSAEKKQIKEESDNYCKMIKEDYEKKKKAFESETTKKMEEDLKLMDEEIRKKEELIIYYKELLSKFQEKETRVVVEPLKSSITGKKIYTTQNIISKKHEISKSYNKKNTESKTGNVNNNSSIINIFNENDKNGFNNDNNSDNRNSMQNDNNNATTSTTTNNSNSNSNSNSNNNANRFKLYNISEPHKFGYFDVNSPDMIRKNIKTQNRSIKSPHITRLLEKIKNRKECQTQGASKKLVSFQSNINNKNFPKMKSSKKPLTFDLFQHF